MRILKNETTGEITLNFDNSYNQVSYMTPNANQKGIALFNNTQNDDNENLSDEELVMRMFGSDVFANTDTNESGVSLQNENLNVANSVFRTGIDNNITQNEMTVATKNELINTPNDKIEIETPIGDDVVNIQDQIVKRIAVNNIKLSHIKSEIKHKSLLNSGFGENNLDTNVTNKLRTLQRDLEHMNTELDQKIDWNTVDNNEYLTVVDTVCKADIDSNGCAISLDERLSLELQVKTAIEAMPEDMFRKLINDLGPSEKQVIVNTISQNAELKQYLLDNNKLEPYNNKARDLIIKHRPRLKLLQAGSISYEVKQLIQNAAFDVYNEYDQELTNTIQAERINPNRFDKAISLLGRL